MHFADVLRHMQCDQAYNICFVKHIDTPATNHLSLAFRGGRSQNFLQTNLSKVFIKSYKSAKTLSFTR